MKNEDWALLNRQALGVIRLTLSRNVAFNIENEKTTARLMSALSSMYEKPSASNKIHLMRRLFNLRMAEGASVAQHLNELKTITTQLSSVEIEFNNEVRALILLSSLPDSWNATVTAVSSSSRNNKLKFDDVRDLVLSEEIRHRESGEASTSSALHMESRGRTSERNSNRGRSKSKRGKSRMGKKDFTCYNCGKKGHFKRDCRALKKDTDAQESANMTEETGDAMILSINSPIESWILDSVASFHSTPCQEIMENYVSGQLDGEGYITTFSGCEWKITKGALVIVHDIVYSDFCANNGIKMETTVPMTPQHNGVAERMNRTLNERARSMRIHAGLPKLLWVEAINIAAYLINHGPSVPLDGGIPEEAWSKKEINFSQLRVFGYISYVHINSAERSKLDAKSNKYVFVVYGGDEFGYRSIIESSSSNIEAETKEFAEFEEISGNDAHISPEAVQEEPCYDEAMQVKDLVKWESSMKDEIDSLMSNQTWELAELPPGKKALHNKWIYRIKEEHDGSKCYKARLVVKCFQQKEGIYYNEIFPPVVKLSIIRLVMKIVAAENLHLEQLDVKTTFHHGDLEEEIYMRQPESFIKADKKNLECRLKKSLYGSDMQEIIHLKQKLLKQFSMKDMGAAKQILGIKIKIDTKSGTLMLSQAEYINKVLSRFNMQDAKPVSYASTIGSLMYAMVCTRPDIAHAVGAVSRYMNNPGKVHWEAVKWILKYLQGTTNKALCFKGGDTILTGYVDADLARNVDIRRSNTGYAYTLGGTAVSWVSQLQKIVAISTTEAEYVAVIEASKEMVWL
ncbi:hypothetical protein F3Y22_tig00111070pilonHSYRG00067 [Hibiscus syriacus]|uniref:CCHC-type domain-containing protein n=1 Tax=Hibiscus syriacus TaxID=106335 RepID=A0A6A2Z5A8_HIBSY|nr:hypothetical protein F3Y22_tig00111070pilonHSYRG00067 [Hibiscus syriacus]